MLCVVPTDKPNFRHEIPSEFRPAWQSLLDRTGLAQKDAVNRLIALLLRQDDVTQAMMLGIVAPAPDLIARALTPQAGPTIRVGRSATREGAPPVLQGPAQSPPASPSGKSRR